MCSKRRLTILAGLIETRFDAAPRVGKAYNKQETQFVQPCGETGTGKNEKLGNQNKPICAESAVGDQVYECAHPRCQARSNAVLLLSLVFTKAFGLSKRHF